MAKIVESPGWSNGNFRAVRFFNEPFRETGGGAPTKRLTMKEMQANQRNCPHSEPIPKDQRRGCGCSMRCTAGFGNQPDGGTDIRNCWACPKSPRRTESPHPDIV